MNIMGLFKNEVGRPSNETIKKRRIAYLIFALLIAFLVGGSIYGIKKAFFNDDITGKRKNVLAGYYTECTGFDSKYLPYEKIYVVPAANISNVYMSKKKDAISVSSGKAPLMIPDDYSTTQGMAVTDKYIVYSMISGKEEIPTQIRFLNRKTLKVDYILEYKSLYHASDMTYDQANNRIIIGAAVSKTKTVVVKDENGEEKAEELNVLERTMATILLDEKTGEPIKNKNGKDFTVTKMKSGVNSKIAYDRDKKRILVAGSGARKKMFVYNNNGTSTQLGQKTSKMCFATSQAMDYYKGSIYYLTWQGTEDNNYNETDNAINVFDSEKGKLQRVLIIDSKTLKGEMEAVEFSPSGEMFLSIGLSAEVDGKLKKWQYVAFYKIKPIVLNTTSEVMVVGQSKKLTASIVPIVSDDTSVEWVSSDPTIATVSSTGVVTGKKAGTVTITAKNANGNASAKVTVEKKVLEDEEYDLVLFWGQSNMRGIDDSHKNVGIKQNSKIAYEYKYLSDSISEIDDERTKYGEYIIYNTNKGVFERASEAGDMALEASKGTNIIPQFVKTYYELTGRKVIAVMAANGGEPISHFLPHSQVLKLSIASSEKKNQYIYEAMVEKYKSAVKYMKDRGYKIGNQFYVSFQGESDTTFIEANKYTGNDYYDRYLSVHNYLKKLGIQYGILIETARDLGKNPNGVEAVHKAQQKLISSNKDIILGSSFPYDNYKKNGKANLLSDTLHFNVSALSKIGKESATSAANYIFDNNTWLKNLKVGGKGINLSSKLTYDVTVTNATSSVEIEASLFSSALKFDSGYGPRKVSLKEGQNVVYLKITSSTKTTKTYTINITRQTAPKKESSTTSKILLGDVATAPDYSKRDQRITACDEYTVNRIIDKKSISSTFNKKYADINGDGLTNKKDGNLINRLITKVNGYYIGDVNKDKKINGDDASLILKFAVEKIDPDSTQKKLADIDGNGVINSDDARIAERVGSGYGDFCKASVYTSGDGKITSADYQAIEYYLNGTIKFTDEQMKAADVNKDGKITKADYNAIKAMVK